MGNATILIFLTVVVLAMAKPIPEDDQGTGQELLKASDTRYYNLPGFWYQRPLNGDDGYGYGYGGNDADYSRPLHYHRESVIPIYEAAGAGWGR